MRKAGLMIRGAFIWMVKAFVWVLTIESRMVEERIEKLRRIPGFERAAEEAARLDRAAGGRRNMHRVLDSYGVPDARWLK